MKIFLFVTTFLFSLSATSQIIISGIQTDSIVTDSISGACFYFNDGSYIDSTTFITNHILDCGNGLTTADSTIACCYFFPGSYTVSHIVWAANGGSSLYQCVVTVFQLDSAISNCGIVNSIEETSQSGCSFFPNPFTSYTTYECDNFNLENSTLVIYDNTGRIMQKQSIDSSKININREKLLNGIYFYRIVSDNKEYTGRLMVY